MSDEQNQAPTSEQQADSKADIRAIAVVFAMLVLMAVHFVSGFTFDF